MKLITVTYDDRDGQNGGKIEGGKGVREEVREKEKERKGKEESNEMRGKGAKK